MFTIRRTQMETFSRALEDASLRRMVAHLRERFGTELAARGLVEPDLEPLARLGLDAARSHGVVLEDDVRRYLECMVILGPDFDREVNWAGEVLRDEERDGTRKMDAIVEILPFAPETRG